MNLSKSNFIIFLLIFILCSGNLFSPAWAESTTTRTAGGLDFTAVGGKRQGREVPQSLRVEPGAKHLVWKTQFKYER